jgi:hypothetical protein
VLGSAFRHNDALLRRSRPVKGRSLPDGPENYITFSAFIEEFDFYQEQKSNRIFAITKILSWAF